MPTLVTVTVLLRIHAKIHIFCLGCHYFLLTCVLSVLFPSCAPALLPDLISPLNLSHASLVSAAPVPGVSPPAPPPLVSSVCISACVDLSLFVGSSVFVCASPELLYLFPCPCALPVLLICSPRLSGPICFCITFVLFHSPAFFCCHFLSLAIFFYFV